MVMGVDWILREKRERWTSFGTAEDVKPSYVLRDLPRILVLSAGIVVFLHPMSACLTIS
jgi:hypothetical protein